MPKVYEQQISWQPAGAQKMQYDKIQDFITPALENATKASQNAMEALQQIGDKRAASELEQASRDAANTIENWDDFSEPEKTQDKMMAAAMEKYDKTFANLDAATQRRINLYNPKAREIFELKAKEKAADVSYDYAYRSSIATLDNDVGRIINESNPQANPYGVKKALDNHLAKMKTTMRPRDYLTYEKQAKVTTEKGLVDWYIAHGMLDKAYDSAIDDKVTGDVNETTRAQWVKSIQTMMKSGDGSGGGSSTSKGNLLDVLVDKGDDIGQALSIMGRMSDVVESNSALPPDLQKYSNVVLAGGKTYNELMQMPYSERVKILKDNAELVTDSIRVQPEVRREFIPIMQEWMNSNVTEEDSDNSGKRKLKKNADITLLKDLMNEYQGKGYARFLMALPNNKDMVDTYNAVMDAIGAEKEAQVLALGGVGQNMSYVQNNPRMQNFFALQTPATKEEAKLFNTPEYTQKMSVVNEGMKVAGALDFLDKLGFDKIGNAKINENMTPVPGNIYATEEVKNLTTPEEIQKYLNESVLTDYNTLGWKDKMTEWVKRGTFGPVSIAASVALSGGDLTRVEMMQNQLDKELKNGKMSKRRHAELSRYLYDLSEGKTTKTYPCLVPNSKMPISVWNQCMTAYGFGEVKDTVSYDAELDRGWHDLSYPLRRATKTKYEAGETGDVLQLLVSYINASVRVPGNSEYFGIPSDYISALTPQVMSDVYNTLEAEYAKRGEIHKLVDVTNNSSVYSQKGGEVDGITWNSVNPSPETTTDITRSKQYMIINDIEQVLGNRLGSQIHISDEMKKQMALNIRQISKGDKGSVKQNISKSTLEDLTNPRVNSVIKNLIGE